MIQGNQLNEATTMEECMFENVDSIQPPKDKPVQQWDWYAII